MMKRMRNIMLAGLIALLPLYLTVTLLIWFFQTLEAFSQPGLERIVGINIWGLGVLTTLLVIFITGVIVSSVTGALFLEWIERILERLPIFKGLYRSIKRIVDSFNPSNPTGFKEFVLVRNTGGEGYSGGFLTGGFSLVEANGDRRDLAMVFIPSNHLYLGAIHIVDRTRIVKTTLTLQDGVTFSLSAGASVSGEVRQLPSSL